MASRKLKTPPFDACELGENQLARSHSAQNALKLHRIMQAITPKQSTDGPSPMEVAECVWGRRPNHKYEDSDIDAYLNYYQRQWDYYHSEQGLSIFQNFGDFAKVVEQIKNGATPGDIISQLEEEHQGKEYAKHVFQDSVELAARTLTIVRVGNPELTWTEKESLRRFLDRQFSKAPVLNCEKTTLMNKAFDAWAIENWGGILIELTDNLADHLRLIRNGSAVLVFHHVSFLKYQDSRHVSPVHSPSPTPFSNPQSLTRCLYSNSELLPPELVKETLKTLSMLFPHKEFSSRVGVGFKHQKGKWLKATCGTWEAKTGGKVDSQLFSCPALVPFEGRRIKTFQYWRDRLVALKQKYDEGPVPQQSVLSAPLSRHRFSPLGVPDQGIA